MSFPFEYDHGAPLAFGGAMPVTRSFDDSKAVVLPIPLDRTTSYVPGTRNGPRETGDDGGKSDVGGVACQNICYRLLPDYLSDGCPSFPNGGV